MRRVAIVAPYFVPHLGGMERYAQRVAGAVRDSPDLDPVVITTNHVDRRDRFDEVDGIPVIRLGGGARLSNTPVNPRWWWQLRGLFRDLDIDIINAHAPVPYLADVATLVSGRRPVVLTYHAGSMAKNRMPVDVVLKAYERLVLPRLFARAQAVVSVSPTSLAHGRVNAVQITPGADVDLFTPSGAPSGPPVILYAGRMDRTSPWKGVSVLLEAFVQVVREVPAARLVLAGGGDATQSYHQQAVRLGLQDRVQFLGVLADQALVRAYQGASVVVLPSTTEAECFPMCLLEAMACGKATVGSRVGGIPHVITEGLTGLLVTPADPAALAAGCARLLTDPGLAARMGREGRQQAEREYAWPKQEARYLELFRSLLPPRQEPSRPPVRTRQESSR